jgi:hypothetical protein
MYGYVTDQYGCRLCGCSPGPEDGTDENRRIEEDHREDNVVRQDRVLGLNVLYDATVATAETTMVVLYASA